MSHRPQATIALRRGHTLRQHVPCGVTIIAAQGHVSLALPATWCTAQLHQAKLRLDEGEAHVVEDAGWILITAQSDAKLMFMADNAIERSFMRILHKLFLLVPDAARRLLART